MNNTKKKGFTMPNNYVVIFAIILLAAVMTYIIPAGMYDRVENADGRMVVVDGSFHYVEQSPVSPFGIFEAISTGFTEVADIMFFIIFAYGWISVLLNNGTFNAMIGGLIIVPIVSSFTQKRKPKDVDQLFECYKVTHTVPAKNSLQED